MSDPFKTNKLKSPETLKHFYTQTNEDVNKGKYSKILEILQVLFKIQITF